MEVLPEPTLRNVWNVIAFLEQSPDDAHAGMTNAAVAAQLRRIHEAYVEGPNKKKPTGDADSLAEQIVRGLHQ